jgi:hypothetical protein
MRKVSILSLIFVIFFTLNSNAQECNLEIESSVTIINGDDYSINPGDVVCLNGGNKDFLLLRNIHGTAENPITFINNNGAVIIDTDHNYGFKIANCSFLKILGNGVENLTYGIQIKRVANGAGVSMDELTTNIELAFTEIANTAIAGLYAKSDPDCSFASSRDNFTMYSLHIHDCYIHHTGDEGMYIGHSKYEDGVYLDDCDTLIFPHLIREVKVYNNILEHLGWDGIQVASADYDCSIYDNIIRYDSERETTWQMSGILIGGGAKCDCYNNQIYDGKGDGIDVLGLGGFKIFNNLIVRAGKSFQPENVNAVKHGIYVGDVLTLPNLEFKFYNNTIVSPKSYGITYNNFVASKARIYNNFIIDPGRSFEGDKGFVNNLTTVSRVDLLNNIYVVEIANAGFKDASNDNYYLNLNSTAVDFGKNLLSEGVSFDIQNHFRPVNTFFDVGAYEWFSPSGLNNGLSDINFITEIFPNPSSRKASFIINTKQNQNIECNLFSLNGKLILNFDEFCISNTDNLVSFDLNIINASIYFLEIKTQSGSIHKKIIIN